MSQDEEQPPTGPRPDPEHLEILKQGVEVWNKWREDNPGIAPCLSGANLQNADLQKANLSGLDLRKATLYGADLAQADLTETNLNRANLVKANLVEADLSGANLHWADLTWANLGGANLYGADLTGATLCYGDLVETRVSEADFYEAQIYGASVWDLQGEPKNQTALLITHPEDASPIEVDNLRVAQFIHLLLHTPDIRDVIDTVTSKVVLILGRFSDERKAVLDALRDRLRQSGYVPVLFDFDKPASKDVTGTVETLARMARFVIADLTDPSSIPHELATVVPFLRTTPVLPLRLRGAGGYSMFDDLKAYPWVLDVHEYANPESLIGSLEAVLLPAEEKVKELRGEEE